MPTHAFLAALAATLGIASLAGVSAVVLRLPESTLRRWLPWWQAIAVGLLAGDATLHMMPDALTHGLPKERLLPLVALAMGALLVLELLVRALRHGGIASFARMNIVGDLTHHLSDGVVIGASFAISIPVGVVVTLAIAGHAIPRELSNAAVLIAGGETRKRAVLWTLATTVALPVGTTLTALLADRPGAIGTTLALASGATLYVALVDLLPPLWRQLGHPRRYAPALGAVAGVALMWLSTLGHLH